MNAEKLIITEINTLGIGHEKYPVQDAVLCCNNDNGIKWIDLYTIMKDVKTQKDKKIKIRIDGTKFMFFDVNEKEWEENVNKAG